MRRFLIVLAAVFAGISQVERMAAGAHPRAVINPDVENDESDAAITTARLQLAWSVASESDARSEERIRRALQTVLTVNYVEQPLAEVVDGIASRLGIPCELDKKALQEAAIDPRTPVTISLRGLPARASLDVLLRPMELTWGYRNGMMVVTTKSNADTILYTRVYPVADLVVPTYTPSGARLSRTEVTVVDFDSLIELMTSTIKPQSWEPAGGPANIKGYESSLALVVSQTCDVHEQVGQLLTALRKSRAAQHVAALEATSIDDSPRDASDVEAYRPTVRQRGMPSAIAGWQVPRTKDGRPFQVQTTPSRPNVGQGFGGGLGGGAF